MPNNSERFLEWDRRQWSSTVRNQEAVERIEMTGADAGAEARWNKAQWVGEDRRGRRPAPEPPRQMAEGEPGISGNRHNPGVQHWAASHSSNDEAGVDTAK
jgi:hypothetical protein